MNKEQLISYSVSTLSFDKKVFDLLEKLMDITLEANEKFNLTAIKDKEKFRELMLLDSLYPLKYFDLSNKKIIDIGTGAGFPGLPLAICSGGEFTLLDSTNKKIVHVNETVKTLNIQNVTGVCDRAEEYARKHRDSFDYAIARAVSSLSVIVELSLPLLKVGGSFIAMKGAKAEEEIKAAKGIIDKLGGEIAIIDEYELPESKEKRTNIIIKKVRPTPNKYPRQYSEIVK